MKILVLGSDGQIGRPLVEYLKGLDYEVAEFDLASSEENDLRKPDILDLSDIDFVFFLAFDVGGSVYLKEYQDTYRFISNNVRIMENTFASLGQFQKSFIFTSSQMAIGSTTYGVLKQIGERYTSSLYGMTVRLWNVYGQETARTHVVTDFIRMARNGRINMKTNGRESRQFLYVDDCCKCLEILMRQYEPMTIDVSSFKWTSILKVADIVAEHFNCPVYPSNIDDTNAEYIPSSKVLNYWQPETSIYEGIKKLINVDSR